MPFIDDSDARVVLAACHEYGSKVAENLFPPVKPGEKGVGLPFFPGADLGRARYFSFTSSKNIVDYSVRRSDDDGQRLDGLMALPRYWLTTDYE